MAKLTLTDIAAGYALITTINANNALIEAALENTVSLDGTTPNALTAALDVNSQAINNLVDATSNQQPVTLAQLTAAQSATISAAAASIVTITDTAGDFVATTVEGALAEIWTLLASVANTEGASFIGLEDAAANFTAINVEAALAELFTANLTLGGALTCDLGLTVKNAGLSVWEDGIQLRNEDNDDNNGITFWNASNDGTMTVRPFGSSLMFENDQGSFDRVFFGENSTFPVSLMLVERASAGTDVATYGQVWSKTAVPNELWYTDDTGQDFPVAGQAARELSTTAALAAVGNAINTSDKKVQGFMVYNTDTDNPCYAAGNAAADIWVDGAGSTVHSPA